MKYTIQSPDGRKITIEAADEATAMRGAKEWAAANPASNAAGAAPAQDSAPASDQGGGQLMRKGFAPAFESGFTQGMTLGFGDELSAALLTPIEMGIDAAQGKPFDIGRSFNQSLEKSRAYDRTARESDPNAAAAGDLVGSLVTGGTAAKGGLTLMKAAKPTIASMATRGAAEGAAYGAVSGAGRADGNLADRAKGAIEGATTGAAFGGVVGGIGGAVAARQAAKAAPTVDSLKAQADTLYQAAEGKGVTFAPRATKTMVDDITANAISEGIDPTLHPRATAALQRLQAVGSTGMTVKEAQTLRRVIASAGKDYTNPDEGRIVGQMLDAFDSYVGKAAPELAAARRVYHQAKKGEMIQQAIELAGSRAGQFSGSGFENALRTEFRGLERKIIKGQLKGLTKIEVDAIRHVARGGPVENVLRWIGKFAPTGVVSFGASAGIPFAVGNAVGGPGVGAAAAGATMGAGLAARAAATRATIGNAERAAQIALSGGRPARPVAPTPFGSVGQVALDALGNESGKYAPGFIQGLALGPYAPASR